ncbi:MAG: OB-fold nucleic acid binding domain-containing protein, partial [Candidatus Micrarchaeia archaeon]
MKTDKETPKDIDLTSILRSDLETQEKYTTHISDLNKKLGEDVLLKGWVYRHRRTGKMLFVVLRDGTGIVQCSINKDSIAP